MSRFEQEISGALGEYWKKAAENELEEIASKLEAGEITIDTQGVARNKIGSPLMNDMLEKVSYITEEVNIEKTRLARDAAVKESIEEYKKNARPYSEEEIKEMRAAFGEGITVVDIFTKEKIVL